MKNFISTLMFVFMIVPTLNAQCVDCPSCGTETAVGFLEQTSNSKTVYEVKQKEIAVPNICLPCFKLFNFGEQFGNLTAPKCCPGKPCGGCEAGDCPKRLREGKIKVVKVLSKKKVKCKACAYEWDVADVEQVNEYLYGKPVSAEEASQPTPAGKKSGPAPAKVKEAPLMEVPAAPKMGWKDRPLFQLKKKDPITFAPAPITHSRPAVISAKPTMVNALPTATSIQPSQTKMLPKRIQSRPKTIKAIPASSPNAFLIRKPGPQN